ncbi:hypothetical protein GGR51DRAFT_505417 [Nemania sp. FL0031]|nr:hypothetical protein GGR51DRAFT_505417 [Nemania sp. FL0031]
MRIERLGAYFGVMHLGYSMDEKPCNTVRTLYCLLICCFADFPVSQASLELVIMSLPRVPSPTEAHAFEESESDEYYDSPADPDADIANTHASNDDLRKEKITGEYFKTLEGVTSLDDKESRERIGSLPTKFCNQAIPLFEKGNIGYQLHVSYTWMKAIHTYRSNDEESDTADWDLHGLAGIDNHGHIRIVGRPLVIIPLGKLFINRSRHSIWTGYELFVGNKMDVWMIYVPNEHDSTTWNTIDSGLFIPAETGTHGVVQICPSLGDLETVSFDQIQERIRSSYNDYSIYTEFYLLEISTRFCDISGPMGHDCPPSEHLARLISDNVDLNPVSRYGLAYPQLLLLAKNSKKPCVQFIPYNEGIDPRSVNRADWSLLRLAIESKSTRLVEMIMQSDVDAYSQRSDLLNDGLLCQADRFGMESCVELIFRRINGNSPDEKVLARFDRAIRDQNCDLIRIYLQRGNIDVAQHRIDGKEPLVWAKDRLNGLESRLGEEDGRQDTRMGLIERFEKIIGMLQTDAKGAVLGGSASL